MFISLLTVLQFLHTLGRSLRDPAFRALLGSVVFTLLAGMVFYHVVEDWGYLDSLYFSVITLTTVGYGDLAPETAPGKIFTMIYILMGIGIILSFITTLADRRWRWFGRPDTDAEE